MFSSSILFGMWLNKNIYHIFEVSFRMFKQTVLLLNLLLSLIPFCMHGTVLRSFFFPIPKSHFLHIEYKFKSLENPRMHKQTLHELELKYWIYKNKISINTFLLSVPKSIILKILSKSSGILNETFSSENDVSLKFCRGFPYLFH